MKESQENIKNDKRRKKKKLVMRENKGTMYTYNIWKVKRKIR